jgi:hypothetical protein
MGFRSASKADALPKRTVSAALAYNAGGLKFGTIRARTERYVNNNTAVKLARTSVEVILRFTTDKSVIFRLVVGSSFAKDQVLERSMCS